MKTGLSRATLPILAAGVSFLSSPAAPGEDTAPALVPVPEFVQKSEFGKSIDPLAGRFKVDADLKDRLFTTFETQQHMDMIIANDDGSMESLTGEISANDLLLVEKTARCESTSQGGHTWVLSNAVLTPDGIDLTITSGAASHPGELVVKIGKDGSFKCAYSANYITPPTPREWRFSKKSLTLCGKEFERGKRLRGWLSVEFEEIDLKSGHKAPLKMEGFFKPVIQTQP